MLPSGVGRLTYHVNAGVGQSAENYACWVKRTFAEDRSRNIAESWKSAIDTGCVRMAKAGAQRKGTAVRFLVRIDLDLLEINKKWKSEELVVELDPSLSDDEMSLRVYEMDREIWRTPAFDHALKEAAKLTALVTGNLMCGHVIDVSIA
jgi:hypothetical protein